MDAANLACRTGREMGMNVVDQEPPAAGREAFTAQQWERAYELLRVADTGQSLTPADLERLSEACTLDGPLRRDARAA